MNKEQFIDTLRRALYGKIDDYTLQDHIRYYEDYIRQENWERGGQNRKYCRNWEIQDCWTRTIVETSSREESGYCLYS